MQELVEEFDYVELEWIPREGSIFMDYLAREAYQRPYHEGVEPIVVYNFRKLDVGTILEYLEEQSIYGLRHMVDILLQLAKTNVKVFFKV